MAKPIRYLPKSGRDSRQRGAVLLLVTFSLVVFLALAALVIDIGRMYIVKSQLQNAADAGALRAALALDTGSGLTASRDKGAEAALKNAYLLTAGSLQDNGSEIVIKVGMSPDGPWVDAVGTGNPGGYYFAKVWTKKEGVATFFTGYPFSQDEANSAAVAVAGRYHIDIFPIAICVPDLAECPATKVDGTCGFTPGLSYPVSEVNPLGPGTYYYIDPEAKGPGCTGCKYSNADDMRPYLCAGKVGPAVSGFTGSFVCTNTGNASGPSFAAIDSRFGDYAPQGQCTPQVGAPDTNVMQYVCADKTKLTDDCLKKHSGFWMIADWMQFPAGSLLGDSVSGKAYDQTAIVGPSPPPPAAMVIGQQGVVWTSVPPVVPFKTTRDVNASYPASTPYAQTTGKYHADPPSPGYPYRKTGRRILHMLIVRCHTTGGVCRDAEVQAIGEFLLTRKTSDNNEMYVEFRRIVAIGSEFSTEIKLHR